MQCIRNHKPVDAGRSRVGAALVEMAVCLPVLMIILIGIIEIGRAMSVDQLLNSAAREGCRVASHDGSTNAEVTEGVKSQVATTVGCNDEHVTVNITITDDETGDPVASLSQATAKDLIEIDIVVPYSQVSYSLSRWLTSSNIRGACAMKHE